MRFLVSATADSVAPLYLAAVVSGLTEVTPMISMAYLADIVTKREALAPAMAFMRGISEGFGIAVALPLSGLIADAYGIRVPFWVALAASVLSFALTYAFVPESLKVKTPFEWSDANMVTKYNHFCAASEEISPALKSLFLFNVAHAFVLTNFVNYFKYAFGWTVAESGLAFGILGLSLGIVPARVITALEQQDAMIVGLASYACGLVGMAFITAGWQFFLLLPFYSVGLAFPSGI